MEASKFVVTVSFPGSGRFQGGMRYQMQSFRDEKKARDYYTDMLLRYPDKEVTFEKR